MTICRCYNCNSHVRSEPHRFPPLLGVAMVEQINKTLLSPCYMGVPVSPNAKKLLWQFGYFPNFSYLYLGKAYTYTSYFFIYMPHLRYEINFIYPNFLHDNLSIPLPKLLTMQKVIHICHLVMLITFSHSLPLPQLS